MGGRSGDPGELSQCSDERIEDRVNSPGVTNKDRSRTNPHHDTRTDRSLGLGVLILVQVVDVGEGDCNVCERQSVDDVDLGGKILLENGFASQSSSGHR